MSVCVRQGYAASHLNPALPKDQPRWGYLWTCGCGNGMAGLTFGSKRLQGWSLWDYL